jgi:hypothetical protein
MRVGNYKDRWAGLPAKIKSKTKTLKLIGCSTGSGDDGRALLELVANEAQAEVTAPTSDIFCSTTDKNISFIWTDGGWQTAKPGQPAVATALSEADVVVENSLSLFVDRRVDVPRNRVGLIDLTLLIGSVGVDVASRISVNTKVLELIDFSHPSVMDAEILAVRTGEVTIGIIGDHGTISRKTYALLSNRWLRDVDNRMYFYRIDSRLEKQLNDLSKSLATTPALDANAPSTGTLNDRSKTILTQMRKDRLTLQPLIDELVKAPIDETKAIAEIQKCQDGTGLFQVFIAISRDPGLPKNVLDTLKKRMNDLHDKPPVLSDGAKAAMANLRIKYPAIQFIIDELLAPTINDLQVIDEIKSCHDTLGLADLLKAIQLEAAISREVKAAIIEQLTL